MRVDDWKILANAELTGFELYNLRVDPRESDDLQNKERERFNALRAQLIQHNAAVEAEGPDWWKRLSANGGTTPRPDGRNRKQAKQELAPAATPKPPNIILTLLLVFPGRGTGPTNHFYAALEAKGASNDSGRASRGVTIRGNSVHDARDKGIDVRGSGHRVENNIGFMIGNNQHAMVSSRQETGTGWSPGSFSLE